MDPTKDDPLKDDDTDSLEGSSAIVQSGSEATPPTNNAPLETPPLNPNGQPSTDSSATPPPKKRRSFSVINSLRHLNIYLVLFIFLIIVAVAITLISLSLEKKDNNGPSVNSENLSAQSLGQIAGASTATIGNSKQVLNIQSDTVFGGQVSIKDNLAVTGSLQVGSSLTLPSINVSGTGAFNSLQATKLSVSGTTTLQGQVIFAGSLSANSLSVNTLSMTGDLTLNHHIDTVGSLPSVSKGSGASGSLTTSVSGTDTAGTISINAGSGDSGCLSDLTFAQKYGSTPHVVITPVGNIGTFTYISNPTATGFDVCVGSSVSGSFAINYIVID